MVAGSRLDYALRYAARGFAVFPLHWIVTGDDGARCCTCGDRECRSPGKHPLNQFVPHGAKDGTTDPEKLTSWFTSAPDANIGMTLGVQSGCFAIDVDPRNGGAVTLEALVAKHGPLPETAMALTGGSGLHYLFRWDGRALAGKLGPGIDVKGQNGYIVVEPSTHLSGVAYCWEGSCDPLDGMAIAVAPAWIGGEALALVAPAATLGGIEHISAEKVLELRSALAFLPADDRDAWVWVGMALKSTQDPKAFGIWTEWSQLSEKFDPVAQRKAWTGFKVERLHVESIFTRAAAAGWVNPRSAQANEFSALDRALADANGNGVQVELVQDTEPAAGADPMPIEILCQIGRWIDSQFPLTHPAITEQAVLALAAAASSRVYVSEENTPAHLYLGLVAETVEYGRYARDAITQIMADAGCRRMVRGTRFNAPTAIYSALVKTPSLVHVCDEFGSLLQQARRQPSGVLEQMLNVLAGAYSPDRLNLENPAEAGIKNAQDDQFVIYAPSITLLALISTDQLSGVLRKSEIGRGALGQMLTVWADSSALQERVARHDPTPQHIIDAWLQVRRIGYAQGDRSTQELFTNFGPKPALIRVRGCAMDQHLAAIDEMTTEPRLRPLVYGAKTNLRRIVTALAPWENAAAPWVSPALLDWATNYVLRHTRAWLERFNTLSTDEGKVNVMQQVLDLIEQSKATGITRPDLVTKCWPYRTLSKEKRDELVGLLLQDETIVEVRPPGRRAMALVAAKYVKKEAAK